MPDESAIIRILQDRIGNDGFVPEDVEVFDMNGGMVVASTDTMVQSTDIPPKMSLADAARKSVAACVSDFAAKGVRPRYGVISVNVPKAFSSQKVANIGTGLKRACDEYGISILGGDVNGGMEIVLSVCLFGSASRIVSRGGANTGDLIFVTGPFGYAPAGLRMFLGKDTGRRAFARRARKAFARPEPRIGFGVESGRYFSSSMDSSDGLAATLNEMSRQSKRRFVIDNVPSTGDVQEHAESIGISSDTLVFHGGEEYEFVFTASQDNREAIMGSAALHGTPVIQIGYVMPGDGVFVKRGNEITCLTGSGWDPFR